MSKKVGKSKKQELLKEIEQSKSDTNKLKRDVYKLRLTVYYLRLQLYIKDISNQVKYNMNSLELYFFGLTLILLKPMVDYKNLVTFLGLLFVVFGLLIWRFKIRPPIEQYGAITLLSHLLIHVFIPGSIILIAFNASS